MVRDLLDIVGLWSRSAMEVVALVTSCYISSGLDGVFMILGRLNWSNYVGKKARNRMFDSCLVIFR